VVALLRHHVRIAAIGYLQGHTPQLDSGTRVVPNLRDIWEGKWTGSLRTASK
jgi:hypothetical protein